MGKFEHGVFVKIAKNSGLLRFLINDNFALFYNRRTTAAEQERNIRYFVVASLFDDFFDNKTLSISALDKMVHHPRTVEPANFDQRAFIDSHLYLISQASDKPGYIKLWERIHTAQKDSLRQFDPTTPYGDLLQISLTKGGISLLMCRHLLDLPVMAEVDSCWFAIGSLIQLTNDLFDIYKDINDKIETFATKAQRYQVVETAYDKCFAGLAAAISKLPFNKEKKIRLCVAFSVISSLGYIAILNLKRLQGESNRLPDLKSLPRKELIIDMAKTVNLSKMYNYMYKCSKALIDNKCNITNIQEAMVPFSSKL